jgi:hypothetical protein
MVFDRNCGSQQWAPGTELAGPLVDVPDGEIRDSNNKHKRLEIAQQCIPLEELAIMLVREDASLICPLQRT